MAEMRHEWNQMQAERTRERIARDTIKHRDRRIKELERGLRLIATADPVDLALDPTWAQRIAKAAL